LPPASHCSPVVPCMSPARQPNFNSGWETSAAARRPRGVGRERLGWTGTHRNSRPATLHGAGGEAMCAATATKWRRAPTPRAAGAQTGRPARREKNWRRSDPPRRPRPQATPTVTWRLHDLFPLPTRVSMGQPVRALAHGNLVILVHHTSCPPGSAGCWRRHLLRHPQSGAPRNIARVGPPPGTGMAMRRPAHAAAPAPLAALATRSTRPASRPTPRSSAGCTLSPRRRRQAHARLPGSDAGGSAGGGSHSPQRQAARRVAGHERLARPGRQRAYAVVVAVQRGRARGRQAAQPPPPHQLRARRGCLSLHINHTRRAA